MPRIRWVFHVFHEDDILFVLLRIQIIRPAIRLCLAQTCDLFGPFRCEGEHPCCSEGMDLERNGMALASIAGLDFNQLTFVVLFLLITASSVRPCRVPDRGPRRLSCRNQKNSD